MLKKQTQRGCALSKKRRKQHNKSVKHRGGDLHKMYSIDNLVQDPQRMMSVDRGLVQAGGKRHGHSRKYLKRGGSNLKCGGSNLKCGGSNLKCGGSALSGFNTIIDQLSSRYMTQPVEYISKPQVSMI